MKVEKIIDNISYTYIFSNIKDLEEKLSTNDYKKTFSNLDNQIKISFKSDKNFDRLRLLVILSPIFIASFDNGKYKLEFLEKTIEKSNFKYGLYEKFFDDFSVDDYFNFYQNHKKNEDIILDSNFNINFSVNLMDDKYLLGLLVLIDDLIVDEKTCQDLLDYFAKIRDDIVINGRRSILANGIQAFYLAKYLVSWALDLYEIIRKNFPDDYYYIKDIYELTNNLKTISNK